MWIARASVQNRSPETYTRWGFSTRFSTLGFNRLLTCLNLMYGSQTYILKAFVKVIHRNEGP
jgi:hypothetical protein